MFKYARERLYHMALVGVPVNEDSASPSSHLAHLLGRELLPNFLTWWPGEAGF